MAAGLALAGCGGSADGANSDVDLSVRSAYIPQPVTDAMAAGYLVVVNKSDSSDDLVSATSDIAEDVTIHETSGQTMKRADRLEVPANGQLVLKTGGTHLMFEKLKRKLKEGETVSVELRFTKTDPIKVEMPVKSATYQPTSSMSSSSSMSSASSASAAISSSVSHH
ncbi:copper chaperone PCu(A)C [Streptomyces sporangiiformans]|uniref:Copper chaperone PCu(A)C n=2 Tax=Streptomyces sporangiiformans TaxID=2315329 RepID=A0A505D325_9ACTN|nr:copper chaperone PCu(A)C [Streptomyces sporangiiformans]TPQ16612.1 copper chaperone PCu(A)C [Streptomyces sporangiiformans]